MARVERRNITFSLPFDLVQKAKILAAKRGTSVNAIVEESLSKVVDAEDRHMAAVRKILEMARSGKHRSRGAKWSREDLYE